MEVTDSPAKGGCASRVYEALVKPIVQVTQFVLQPNGFVDLYVCCGDVAYFTLAK